MLTERGLVFYSWKGGNRFDMYLKVQGIDHTHPSADNPKTQGEIEALNGHSRREPLVHQHFNTLKEAEGTISRCISTIAMSRPSKGFGVFWCPVIDFTA